MRSINIVSNNNRENRINAGTKIFHIEEIIFIPFAQPKFHPNRDKSKQHQRPLFSIGVMEFESVWNQFYLIKISNFFFIDLIISNSIDHSRCHTATNQRLVSLHLSEITLTYCNDSCNSGIPAPLSNFLAIEFWK